MVRLFRWPSSAYNYFIHHHVGADSCAQRDGYWLRDWSCERNDVAGLRQWHSANSVSEQHRERSDSPYHDCIGVADEVCDAAGDDSQDWWGGEAGQCGCGSGRGWDLGYRGIVVIR